MKVFVVPATYNEKDNIEKFITVLEKEVFPTIKNHEMHILVADDYSPDGTGDIVKTLMKKYKNLGINQGERKGLGAAYIRTMGYAVEKLGADVVISIDADFQFDPFDLPKFIKKIDEGYDMVVQTRYSEGGSIPENWPPQRKLFSMTANLFVRSVFMKFSIHDWTGGFRAITKNVFLKVSPKMTGFNGYIFQIAFLHQAVVDGFKIGEVPLHFSDRKLGSSKIAPLKYIMDVLKFVIFTRIKEIVTGSFGKFLVVGGLGFVINFLVLWIFHNIYHLDPFFANLIGAGAAIFSNYNFNNLWTFKEQKIHGFGTYLWKMIQFYATSAFGVIFIQSGTIFIGDLIIKPDVVFHFGPLGVRFYILYFLLGTFFILIWNYFIYSKFIWRKKTTK